MANQISEEPLLTLGPQTAANLFSMKRNVFLWLALLLVGMAILRSAITTRLDSFTIDEAGACKQAAIIAKEVTSPISACC
jgi:hypothetical protein